MRVPCPNCNRQTQIARRVSSTGTFALLCPGCERVLQVDESTRDELGYGTVTAEAPRPRGQTAR